MLTHRVATDGIAIKTQRLSVLPASTIASIFGLRLSPVETAPVLRFAQKLDSTDTGCYVVLWRLVHLPEPHWAPACGLTVGDVSTAKFQQYVMFAHEKAARLSAHPEHDLSFQSRDESDPAHPKYPGAVRMSVGDVILSCSGLAWQFDELMCLIVGHRMGLMDEVNRQRLIQLSNNQHALEYLAKAA